MTSPMRENHMKNIFSDSILENSKYSLLPVVTLIPFQVNFDSGVVQAAIGSGASIWFFDFDTCW